jgi:CheY-like chemotaxis protein
MLPTLILTDLMMPEMDGFALITALHAEGIRAPVIVIAANAAEQVRALQAGADAFISKGELLTALPVVLKQFVPQAAY